MKKYSPQKNTPVLGTYMKAEDSPSVIYIYIGCHLFILNVGFEALDKVDGS
jgi:hypothetical protein